MPRFEPDIAGRFWAKVEKTKTCWVWTARINNHGYGVFRLSRPVRREVYAHRFAWELTNGDPSPLWVLHQCDTPRCVNPKHLFLGTQEKNARDMALKRRGNTVKLTDEGVQIIKQLCKGHQSYGMTKHLAELFGVDRHTIQRAARGISFKPLYDDEWDDEWNEEN